MSEATKGAKRVVIESPYGSEDEAVVSANVEYARRAMKDSFDRGEAPYASHLLYTQVLKDATPSERQLGLEAGDAWREVAELTAFYVDRGWSPGMKRAEAICQLHGLPYVERTLLSTEEILHGQREACRLGRHSFSWREGLAACRYCKEPRKRSGVLPTLYLSSDPSELPSPQQLYRPSRVIIPPELASPKVMAATTLGEVADAMVDDAFEQSFSKRFRARYNALGPMPTREEWKAVCVETMADIEKWPKEESDAG